MTHFSAPNDPGRRENSPDAGAERVPAGHSAAVAAKLTRLASLIATSPHNLVSTQDRGAVFERHIVECVALARELPGTGRWLDLGTGGGLPGLVVAITHPASAWTLLDATRKKVDAVTRFVTALDIPNAEALAGRAESLARHSAHRGEYHGVVARAVAPLPVLAELARGFLRHGGELFAMKGPSWREELVAAESALATLHLTVVHTRRLTIPGRESWVVTMRAEGPPPPDYPRRDGIPRQQPL